tara:strand:+ start:34 stop:1272 length:1239 start_codon:yes stop_codon:yes gene_type:complete
MAITNKESGVWGTNQVYKKQNEGKIWDYKWGASLYVCGMNAYGELGQNALNPTGLSSPVQIPGTYVNVSSSSNERISAAVKTDGTLWTWGRDYAGSSGWNLDGGGNTMRSSPVQIPGFPPSTGWEPIYETGMIGCAPLGTSYIDEDGSLWEWGRNEYGQLGQGNRTQYSSPVLVGAKGIWSQNLAFNDDACRLCVRRGGTLWAWGNNSAAQLGQGNLTQYSSPRQIGTDSNWPTEIGTLTRNSATSAAIRSDGALFTWGMGQGGELGHNQAGQTKLSSPQQVGENTNWTYVACTGQSILATNSDGELWTMGWGEYGALGLNSVANISSPVQIPGTTWYRPADCNKSAAAVTKTDGTLWVWGRNTKGSLGQNNTTQYSSPIQFGTATHWNNAPARAVASIGGDYASTSAFLIE